MEKLKVVFDRNFEQLFVLALLLVTAAINHFIDQKLAFLNFYFLPIIISGYYLGTRKSIFGSVLSALLVLGYVMLDPQKFRVEYSSADLYLHLIVWACFLVLSGAVIGKQQEKLTNSVKGVLDLNESLQSKQIELNAANDSLKEYSSNLEGMVSRRTEELESSKLTLETLKGKVESTLYSTMDASVAKLIIEGRLRSDKRKISVMFSDLAGFTSYSEERGPETVVKDLNSYLSEMEPILMGFHGHIDKFLGDGIMAEFGAPVDYTQYRLLAVLTGIKMQERMDKIDLPWKMRIGVASGSAITGLIGSQRQAYTSIGDVVNVASRLEGLCPVSEFLIDEYTLEGVSRYIDVEPFNLLNADDVVSRENISRIKQIEESLIEESDSKVIAEKQREIGEIYIELGQFDLAKQALENAVSSQPDDKNYKVALADFVMDRDKKSKVKVKGRREMVKSFKVVGLKDMLEDSGKIPKSLYEKYKPILSEISIPRDIALKAEAVDGSIGHGLGVALISYAIATKLNVFDKEASDILVAGFAADFGKTIVPHHVLNRNGPLSDSEMAEVYKHPNESVRLLRNLGYHSEGVLDIIECSHEKLDGSGYPNQLRGDDIPLGSRIVAVADVFDSLTSWRPYREKWNMMAALDELEKSASKGWYDRNVVDALVSLIDEHSTGTGSNRKNLAS